jgi:hypothetical protein
LARIPVNRPALSTLRIIPHGGRRRALFPRRPAVLKCFLRFGTGSMNIINNIAKTLKDGLAVERKKDSRVSIAASCFSMYAYRELKNSLNPVRITRRFGRIDRIGSKNGVIQLVNFWPDTDLEIHKS